LNPIELIWAHVKGFVAEINTTFRLKDVKELVYGRFGRITKEVWAKAKKPCRMLCCVLKDNLVRQLFTD
jgi:hypothetical protein